MKTVLAIIVWTLSLFGIEVGSRVQVDHIRSNDTDVLVSRVVARPTGTRFECVRSASGQCYYTVRPSACIPREGMKCDGTSVEQFALANGASRQMASLSKARICVSADATAARSDCN